VQSVRIAPVNIGDHPRIHLVEAWLSVTQARRVAFAAKPCEHPGAMQFEDVAARIAGIPYMSPALGRRVYDHVRATQTELVLELGTAHGVSAAYIAAALDANGRGHLTTVDHGAAAFDPAPEDVLARAGLAHRVTIVRKHSSYNWFLKEQVEQASDKHGNSTPVYDFVYLDGSKNFSVDGLAVVLIEKLLRPAGWLLMDDLEWTYAHNPWVAPDLAPNGNACPFGPLSDSERTEPHLLAVFELIVKQHPSFTRFIREDEWYGWAQKGGGQRRYELATSRPLGALLAAELRRRWRLRVRRA
jgi:predicted O-methyltransferase YrrM